MNSFLLLLQYALIIVGIIEIPVGFSLAKSSGCYVSAIFGIWLILELVVFSVIKSKVPKWVLAFMATIGMASLFIKYTFTGELRNFGLALMLLIGPVCFTPMYPLSLLGDWISKEKAKEPALTKYKNDKNILRTLERDIDGKQQLLNQQNRLLEITALLNACGSSTVSIQKNQNYKRAEDIKTQLAELEAQRAKIEFSIEAYEEGKAQQSA